MGYKQGAPSARIVRVSELVGGDARSLQHHHHHHDDDDDDDGTEITNRPMTHDGDDVAAKAFIPGDTVRVLARLVHVDVYTNHAVVEDLTGPTPRARLLVNVKLLNDFSAPLKSLVQFIGELEIAPAEANVLRLDDELERAADSRSSPMVSTTEPVFALRARLARNVEGLDVKMYHRALDLRRRFDSFCLQQD